MRKVERIDPKSVDPLRLRDALAIALGGGPAIALALTPLDHVHLPENVALIIETGGSTGKGKLVGLSAHAMQASARLSNQALGAVKGDRWSLSLPLHHIAGVNQLLRAIDLGSDPTSIGGQFISIVPTQLYRALQSGNDTLEQLKSAKKVLIGGAAIPEQLLDQGRAAGVPLVTSYGMTEMCGGCVYDGIALPGVSIRIAPTGRIALKGPMRAEGYFGDDDENAKAFVDDWFISNDEGNFDSHGILHIAGRIDDVIICGGEKISTTAVAEVLRTAFPLAEIHVLGVRDPHWGQALRVVMTRASQSEISLEQIRSLVAQSLGRIAAPRSLLLVSEVPVKSNGKVDLVTLAAAPATEEI